MPWAFLLLYRHPSQHSSGKRAAIPVQSVMQTLLGSFGRSVRCALFVTVFSVSTSTVSVAQTDELRCVDIQKVFAVPDRPVAGTLFSLRVVAGGGYLADSSPRLIATAAGEPLHFSRSNDTLVARAAVPVDSVLGVTVQLTCGDGTTQSFRLPVTSGSYPMEKLSVAPRFGARPDSAIAARTQREAAQAAAVSRNAHLTPMLWSEPFIAPRSSRITSGFGNGRTFNGAVTSRHTGTDYAGAIGAPVRAINRGVVRIVDSFYLGGNVVYIDHGAGVVSAYLHLSKATVAVGDTVQRSAIIGSVGATGRVTGPHLHLITRYGNISVDSRSLIGNR